MIRLKNFAPLERPVRQDDPAALPIPTWDLVKRAVKSGKTVKALEFIEYEYSGDRGMHDLLIQLLEGLITNTARFGEEEVPKAWRQAFESFAKTRTSLKLDARQTMLLDAEAHRNHFGEFTVAEEPDRYVLTLDPCGSGGRIRRTQPVGLTKKPYSWSWGRKSVPYYCTHCSIIWEIIPTEIIGYPLRLSEIGEKPEDPCVHIFYKRPELIPEEYFRRIGMKKTIK